MPHPGTDKVGNYLAVAQAGGGGEPGVHLELTDKLIYNKASIITHEYMYAIDFTEKH